MVNFLLVIYFLVAVAAFSFQLVYQMTDGRDERGRQLLGHTMSISFPLLVMGWCILEVVNRLADLSRDQYHYGVVFIVTGCYIVQSGILFILHSRR